MDGSERRNNRRVGVWVAAGAIVVLCVLAASSGSIQLWEDPGPSESRPAPQRDTPAPDEDPEPDVDGTIDLPDLSWALDVVNVLVLLFLVIAIALAISDRNSWLWRLRWRFRPRSRSTSARTAPDVRPQPLEVDVEAATEALAIGTPRNAIVRCWMQLERDASAVGLTRFDAETSAEYVERVVASSSVDPGPIGELAALYREARFSRHELDDAHRAAARRALDGVAEQLEASGRIEARA